MDNWRCPESVDEMHYSSRSDGHCNWCGKKIYPKQSAPGPGKVSITILTTYYDYYYDPDFGIETPRSGQRGGIR